MTVFGVLVIVYTLLDFSFNRPKPVSYQFQIPELTLNKPVILKQGNMMIIVARYSQTFIESLESDGRISRISSSFKEQHNLVDKEGYFVVLGYGTHLNCPLVITEQLLMESCSDARYNWIGKSHNLALYDSLQKVDHGFSLNHSILTIN